MTQEQCEVSRAYLDEVKEALADLHELECRSDEEHQAIAFCECRTAKLYRQTKQHARG